MELVDVPPMVEVDRPGTEPTIEIDGVTYPMPNVNELDLDEEEILFDVAGVILPDFMPAHPTAPQELKDAVGLMLAARIRNPRFKRALVMIAYRRANPDLDRDALSERIGKVNAFDAELALYGKAREAEEEDADRP